MKSIILYTLVAAALSVGGFTTNQAAAKQYRTADGKVAHTRAAPVIVHRALPPFKGQHVYRR